MEWVPPPKAEVLKLAVPKVRGKLEEIATGPSKKVTVPVAEDGVTLAVKVNEVPNTEGFVPLLRRTLIEEFALGLFTVCNSAADVPPLNLASPLYCAVTEWVPKDKVEMVTLAEPVTKGSSPEMAVEPSKKTTAPVAVEGATFAVKVRASPVSAGLVPPVRLTVTVALPLTTFWTSAELTDALCWLSPV